MNRHDRVRWLWLVLALLPGLAAMALEMPVAEPARSGMRGNDHAEAAASDGTDFLFIWRAESGRSLRYAARVTRDGVVHERVAVPLLWRVEQLVWTGNSYLALWSAQDAGGRYSIEAMRLDRNGNVLLSESGSHRTLKSNAFLMGCVADGEHVAIAYTDHGDGIVTRRPKALLLDRDTKPVADLTLAAEDWRMSFVIAARGSGSFAAAWIAWSNPDAPYEQRQYEAHAVRFNATSVLDSASRTIVEGTATAAQTLRLSLQSDGNEFLILHPDAGRVFARRLDATLIPQGTSRILPESFDQTWNSRFYSNGSSYVIVTQQSSAPVAVRLDRDGSPQQMQAIEYAPGSTGTGEWVSAMNAQDLAIAWSGTAPGSGCADSDLFATLVAPSTLERRVQQLVSIGPREQRQPIVGAGNATLLAAWSSGSVVYTRRFDSSGAPLDAPLLLAECGSALAIVPSGADYFVFVSRSGGFEIRRVPQDGLLRSEPGASVNGALLEAVQTSQGVVILWADGNAYRLARVSDTGALLQSKEVGPLAAEGSRLRALTMAAGVDGFLLAWHEERETLYCTPDLFYSPPIPGVCYARTVVRAARYSREFVSLDPRGIDVATHSPFESAPTVAWNGSNWLVAWSSAGTPRTLEGPRLPDEIRGRLVQPDGRLDGDAAGVFIARDATAPDLAWDGERFVLHWQPVVSVYESQPPTRIGWLRTLGGPLESKNEIDASSHPFFVPAGPGKVAVTYARQVEDANDPFFHRAFVSILESAGPRRRAVR